jgi:DME family drug/metabolite transporter
MPLAAARRGGGLFFLVLAGVLWGTGGLTGSLLGQAAGLSPVAVATYRIAIGGMLIVVFLVVTGRRLPRGWAVWRRVTQVGLLAALYQVCYFSAVSLTTVSLATLVTIGTCPVLVLVMEWITGRRSPGGRVIPTLCLALTGLGLLIGMPGDDLTLSAVLAGSGLAVLSAAGFAAVTLLGARPIDGLDDLTTTGAGFTLGGLLLMPLAAVTTGLSFTPDVAVIGLLLILGVAPTALAYTLYFRGLRTESPTIAAVMALLEPLVGTVLAAIALGDRLGAAGIAGACLLMGAVLFAGTAPRPTVPVLGQHQG